jgi:hypothetical protein
MFGLRQERCEGVEMISNVLYNEEKFNLHPCPPKDTLMRWCNVVEAPSMRISGKISVWPTGVDL